jgi:hypothetical protein
MRLRSLLALVLFAVLAFSATGCQRLLDSITPPALVNTVIQKAKVGDPSAKVSGKLEAGYPSNLPFWEGATVSKTHVVKAKSGNSWTATLITTDPYGEVVNGMAQGLQNAGWTAELAAETSTGTSSTVMTVLSSSGTGVVTIVAKKDNTTAIGYVIQSTEK